MTSTREAEARQTGFSGTEAPETDVVAMPNGSGAAAILSAGIGCFLVAVLAIAADKSMFVKSLMSFYKPTGPLSGVTTMAVVGWLLAWAALGFRWRKRDVALARLSTAAVVLLVLSFLLTFPPIADLF
jgi:hypothetical protein